MKSGTPVVVVRGDGTTLDHLIYVAAKATNLLPQPPKKEVK